MAVPLKDEQDSTTIQAFKTLIEKETKRTNCGPIEVESLIIKHFWTFLNK